MPTQRKKPKTAIVAFAQELLESSGASTQRKQLEQNKTPPASKHLEPKHPLSRLTAEAETFLLPSGKKAKFTPKAIEASQCCAWSGNSRFQESMDPVALEELKTSIRAQGQLVPALARPARGAIANQGFTHEVIYGSRRLKACQELGIKLKILEAEINDNDALFFMDAENAARVDLSLYEKAKSYAKWLNDGIFESKDDLANAIGVSRRWINKALTVLNIPQYIIDALPHLADLTKSKAEEILDFLQKYPNQDDCVQKAIEVLKLKNTNYDISELINTILNCAPKSMQKHDVSYVAAEFDQKHITTVDGEKLLTVSTSKAGKIKLELNIKLSPKRIAKFLDGIERVAKKV